MKKTSELPDLIFSLLRPTDAAEGDRFVFKPQSKEKIRAAIEAFPSGEARISALKELGFVIKYLHQDQESPKLAEELVMLLEPYAKPEVEQRKVDDAAEKNRQRDAGLEKTADRVEELGQKFENFFGRQAERLPDTGERLDPKLFKGPIRG